MNEYNSSINLCSLVFCIVSFSYSRPSPSNSSCRESSVNLKTLGVNEQLTCAGLAVQPFHRELVLRGNPFGFSLQVFSNCRTSAKEDSDRLSLLVRAMGPGDGL